MNKRIERILRRSCSAFHPGRILCLGLMLGSAALLFGCATGGSNVSTKVVLVSPRHGASGVNPNTTIEIHFSNGLTLTTINPDSIRLLDATGQLVPAQLGSDIEGDVIHIQPSERLRPHTIYTLEVTHELADKEGARVHAFHSSFTTGAELPATPRKLDPNSPKQK